MVDQIQDNPEHAQPNLPHAQVAHDREEEILSLEDNTRAVNQPTGTLTIPSTSHPTAIQSTITLINSPSIFSIRIDIYVTLGAITLLLAACTLPENAKVWTVVKWQENFVTADDNPLARWREYKVGTGNMFTEQALFVLDSLDTVDTALCDASTYMGSVLQSLETTQWDRNVVDGVTLDETVIREIELAKKKVGGLKVGLNDLCKMKTTSLRSVAQEFFHRMPGHTANLTRSCHLATFPLPTLQYVSQAPQPRPESQTCTFWGRFALGVLQNMEVAEFVWLQLRELSSEFARVNSEIDGIFLRRQYFPSSSSSLSSKPKRTAKEKAGDEELGLTGIILRRLLNSYGSKRIDEITENCGNVTSSLQSARTQLLGFRERWWFVLYIITPQIQGKVKGHRKSNPVSKCMLSEVYTHRMRNVREKDSVKQKLAWVEARLQARYSSYSSSSSPPECSRVSFETNATAKTEEFLKSMPRLTFPIPYTGIADILADVLEPVFGALADANAAEADDEEESMWFSRQYE